MQDFERFVGRWSGTCRLRFKPTDDAIVSDATATARLVAGGKGLLVETATRHRGDESIGAMLFSADGAIHWVDSYHAEDGMHFTGGRATYAEVWGWTIALDLEDGQLVLRHENVPPTDPAYLALELKLARA